MMTGQTKERIIIKNFGPIKDMDLLVSPFVVLIGESGSGKSVFMKLLATCRWIHKKVSFASIVAYIEPTNKDRKAINFYKKLYGQQIKEIKIEALMKNGGLDDFIDKDGNTEIIYEVDDFKIIIHNHGHSKKEGITLEMPQDFVMEQEQIVLKKLSFISDDRFTIPLMLQGAHFGYIPFHLERTYRDFIFASQNASNKTWKTATLGLNLTQEKKKDVTHFFIEKDGSKVPFHNASSGIKSIAIIETIANYYALDYDLSSSVNRFFFSQFAIVEDFNYILDIALNLKKNVEIGLPEYKKEINLFIEEPEISLFPQAQYELISHLVMLFLSSSHKKQMQYIFSTHSPYMLSALNCFLKAEKLARKKPLLVDEIKKIVPENNWLNSQALDVLLVDNGKIQTLIDKETQLIAAEKIDAVSDHIGNVFDNLLDLEYQTI